MYFHFDMKLDNGETIDIESECNNGFDVDYVSAFIGEVEVYEALSEKNQGMIMEELFKRISSSRHTCIYERED